MSRAFHGPLSPLGAAAGVLLVLATFAVGLAEISAWICWLVGPGLGLLLLAVPGPVRQVGTGLIASALTLPLLLLGVLLLGVAG